VHLEVLVPLSEFITLFSSSSVIVSCAYRVSVQTGGSTTIPCHYGQKYKTHVKYWCIGYDLHSCSPVIRTDSTKSTDKASISDDINQLTITVTMTDLGTEDSGRYWCAVEINGGPDVRTGLFHLSVSPGKISATLPYDYMTGVLVSFTGITIIVQVDMRNVGICLLFVGWTLV
uniref:Immunoglobulin domain-containing protein n=1 Tax=Oncorhynchus kisutch TaxID=8019 RepID=A0A8C7KCP2_ONCKI